MNSALCSISLSESRTKSPRIFRNLTYSPSFRILTPSLKFRFFYSTTFAGESGRIGIFLGLSFPTVTDDCIVKDCKFEMKKYGLQLRAPPQSKKPLKAPLPPPPGFLNDDSDEENVENEIARHAAKKRSIKEVEDLHKKALEEDPSVFDYDGVYDQMKSQIANPIQQDRQKRESFFFKSKYIGKLIEKAKKREQEHEIIYERKLAKERGKEDHLYEDKEKFVTNAYKKKLAEQAKWLEEERLRELREEKEDVTKKSDMSDFYANLLTKNVAFGAKASASDRTSRKPAPLEEPRHSANSPHVGLEDSKESVGASQMQEHSSTPPVEMQNHQAERHSDNPSYAESVLHPSLSENVENKHVSAGEVDTSVEGERRPQYKRSEDALAAAKERYLARKRAKE
ncbi:nuclear speckle splicing regulatory protein 1 isoform X1 [Amborella trichopoda]|uniref:nuclear speckle splicing regulatory protein 1 isoform X1 n=1 Tax=Amborella trichopoda TaxID=13333 RepID=UPI0009BF821F|nr:nuclear speckle splicing regulatory protein 1 isoform X1 [Amborella trichopoda]|eukprot:XP_011627532.2 nuclear speckle splicing regulatory protein 1 isoform X1 [Amborella trichopoda]